MSRNAIENGLGTQKSTEILLILHLMHFKVKLLHANTNYRICIYHIYMLSTLVRTIYIQEYIQVQVSHSTSFDIRMHRNTTHQVYIERYM